jgi:tetraacyldisaccharide 4'-kinase
VQATAIDRGTFISMLSALYAAVVRRRREYYAARPHLRRRLRRPVVSIGNLAMGGRGKTPVAASVARMLMEMGERPAILSRGYARRRAEDGVVVVSDPQDIRADVDRAGDEPLMLARQVPGAVVMASADRYLAGCLAERQFGATVHILDDGFQHLQLDRDADIVIVAREDVARPQTIPSGRLREPLDTLIAADAILTADDDVTVETVPHVDIPLFRLRRAFDTKPADEAVFAVAGIAAPDRFAADLRSAGWTVAGAMTFRDHHPYSRRDLARIVDAARSAGASAVVTTEKDLVRLLRFRPFAMPVTAVALTIEPDPRAEFRKWLAGSIAAARDVAAPC